VASQPPTILAWPNSTSIYDLPLIRPSGFVNSGGVTADLASGFGRTVSRVVISLNLMHRKCRVMEETALPRPIAFPQETGHTHLGNQYEYES
jgi:hypothetical protein